MPLTIFNGSPRNKKSNSALLIRQFADGYAAVSGQDPEPHYLAATGKLQSQVAAFEAANDVLLVFPLYTDSMPAIVKSFLEAVYTARPSGPKRLGFVVQSGFAESVHGSFVAAYLEKFARRMGYECIGTIIKGGVEGIQIMPPRMTRKLFRDFYDLGAYFAKTGTFDPAIKARLAKPFRLRKTSIFFMKLAPSFLRNFYWNMNLRKHKAMHLRDARPFVDESL